MKPINKGNHPCPVLLEDGGDYLRSTINLEVGNCSSITGEGMGAVYHYPVSVTLKCPPLEALIEEGRAKVYICIEQSTVRKIVEYQDGGEIEINPYELRLARNVEVTPLVIACDKTELQFDAKYMDHLYGLFDKKAFSIEKGQILAYGEPQNIKTNPVKGLSQIVKVRELKKPDDVRPFILDLTGDKIIILANKEITRNLEVIQDGSMKLGGLVNAVLAYPVFYMVITAMITNSSDYEEKKWYVAIKNKINDLRKAKNQEEFEPSKGLVNLNDEAGRDYLWELTSQLLTASEGQLMLVAFETAGSLEEK